MKIYDFMKHRNLWFGISGAVIALGLIMMLINGLNFGIDFKGGTKLVVELGEGFDKPTVDEIVKNSESNSQSCYNTGNYIWIFVIIAILFIFGGFLF